MIQLILTTLNSRFHGNRESRTEVTQGWEEKGEDSLDLTRRVSACECRRSGSVMGGTSWMYLTSPNGHWKTSNGQPSVRAEESVLYLMAHPHPQHCFACTGSLFKGSIENLSHTNSITASIFINGKSMSPSVLTYFSLCNMTPLWEWHSFWLLLSWIHNKFRDNCPRQQTKLHVTRKVDQRFANWQAMGSWPAGLFCLFIWYF